MKKVLFGALTLVGVGLVIGTAGASDANIVTWLEIVRNLVIGTVIASVGVVGLQRQGVQIFE
jgi:hypothetical protein